MRRLLLLVVAALIGTMMSVPAFATEMTKSERRAVEILGLGKVLGYRDVCLIQKTKLPDVEPTMPFSEDVLRECAKANAQGANWRLAYVVGYSLREENRVINLNNVEGPPLLFWMHLSPQEEEPDNLYTTKAIEPGYRLLDFTNRFTSTLTIPGWGAQEAAIAKLGPNFERAEEQAVAEVCFSNFLLSSRHVQFLANWYHWGRIRARGSHVYVGHTSVYGLDRKNPSIGVVIAWRSSPAIIERTVIDINNILTQAERRAVEILGPGKVLGYRDVCRVQKAELPKTEPTIPFSEAVLLDCAKANIEGADWRLVYVVGHSLRQESMVVGWDLKKQPCFDPDFRWWLVKAEDPWANQAIEPGYRLFDFTKRFSDLPWQDQTDQIIKLGPNFERAEEQAVTEICFSNFLLSNNQERLLAHWCHWGRLQSSNGRHIIIGDFEQFGFYVYDIPTGIVSGSFAVTDRGGYLGVVLARKP